MGSNNFWGTKQYPIFSRIDLSFCMGTCENTWESDRDPLLIVVKVFSLHSAQSFTLRNIWWCDHKKTGKISWICCILWKYEFSVRKYLTPLPCTRLLFATGWWVCKSWQVEVKDRAERSEKTLTTMSKESLSDSHLFSHIPMPKLKSTLAKCATFIYSTHKFIKYKINGGMWKLWAPTFD